MTLTKQVWILWEVPEASLPFILHTAIYDIITRCIIARYLSPDYRRIVFLLAEAIHGVSAEILNLQISWQAQYLVRLEADCACSAHCK